MVRDRMKSDACVAFGARVRAAREARTMPRAALASQLGVTVDGLAKLEAGDNWPTVPRLLDIARALDCSADALLGHDRVIQSLSDVEAEALAILRRLPEERVALALSVLASIQKS